MTTMRKWLEFAQIVKTGSHDKTQQPSEKQQGEETGLVLDRDLPSWLSVHKGHVLLWYPEDHRTNLPAEIHRDTFQHGYWQIRRLHVLTANDILLM